jgi:hypothetical protein
MNKNIFKNATPYLIAIIVFLAITLVYFSPLLEGKKLKQHDIAMFKGMSKEISDFREKTGEEALWTNSMFGGMPAWQVSVQYNGNLTRYVDKILTLGLPSPANFVFLYFLGFFVLLLVLRVNPWISMVGAIAYALSSYFFIILGAGHTSKAHAIAYMAPVLAGIILTFRGKYLAGAVLTALALALEIKAGHLQITYYLLMIVVIYGLYQFICSLQEKKMAHFFKVMGLLSVAALLAASTHFTNLWTTYDYGKDTMRGKPELTREATVKSNGLDRDYITNWSYGIGESWSLMIPNAKGGGSALIGKSKALEAAEPAYRNAIEGQNAYWGDQPGTSGPVYVGVIVVFLFVLGMFIFKSRIKWVLLAVTVLSIMLAWGRNFMPITDFFIDYIPGYNKFRAVTMILVMAEFTIPLLAFLALNKIVSEPELLKNNLKPFFISSGIVAGLILLFYALPSTFFSFLSANEVQQFRDLQKGADGAQYLAYQNNLEAVRIAMFRSDALRSLFFAVAAIVLIYFFVKQKLNQVILISALAVLILIDMFSLNKRYINNDNFVRAKQAEVPFQASNANKEILNDNDPDFRVLDLSVSTFNDASASYFHKSIGGYHGAKLQRYQDLIDEYIQPEIMSFIGVLQSKPTMATVDAALSQMQVVNMLNTKYFIINPDGAPLPNDYAFDAAWLVDNFVLVKNADEEIAALGQNNLKKVAVFDERFAQQVSGKTFEKDSTAIIRLKSYEPNKLVYDVKSGKDQIAVFSEIYYDKGWNAYLDGQQVPYFRANYVLRAMAVPAGEHEIVFKFEPRIWVVGEKISFASSLLLILLVLSVLVFEIKNAVAKK